MKSFIFSICVHAMLSLKRILGRPLNHRKLRKLKSPAYLNLDIVQIALSFLVLWLSFNKHKDKVQFYLGSPAQPMIALFLFYQLLIN